MLTSQIRLFSIAWFRSHATFWTITKWMLVIWGAMNGFGLGLLGRVERLKHRISKRVPRVSGSAPG